MNVEQWGTQDTLEGDAEATGDVWKTGGAPTWSGMLSIHGSSLMCINPGAACSSPFKL